MIISPVIVQGMPSDVNHGVQGEGASPDPPPGPVHPPAVHVCLGGGVVVPVVPGPENIYFL